MEWVKGQKIPSCKGGRMACSILELPAGELNYCI